jgi:putative Holliday junction resolvase
VTDIKDRYAPLSPDVSFSCLAEEGAFLALDPGKKRIGIALSDLRRVIASPLAVLVRKKFTIDSQELITLIAQHNVCALIIGFPLNMNGTEGGASQSVRDFSINLQEKVSCPIIFWDERWTSQAAERTLLACNMSRKSRGTVLDKLAATLILQSFLDYYNS